MKILRFFSTENFPILFLVKFSIYLNRRVFVMLSRPHPSSFTLDSVKAVPLSQFSFVRASLVSYVTFVSSLLFPLLSFFLCFGKIMLRGRTGS